MINLAYELPCNKNDIEVYAEPLCSTLDNALEIVPYLKNVKYVVLNCTDIGLYHLYNSIMYAPYKLTCYLSNLKKRFLYAHDRNLFIYNREEEYKKLVDDITNNKKDNSYLCEIGALYVFLNKINNEEFDFTNENEILQLHDFLYNNRYTVYFDYKDCFLFIKDMYELDAPDLSKFMFINNRKLLHQQHIKFLPSVEVNLPLQKEIATEFSNTIKNGWLCFQYNDAFNFNEMTDIYYLYNGWKRTELSTEMEDKNFAILIKNY